MSASQLGSLECRLLWYWSYPMGYKPIRKNINLELGSGIHIALDEYYGSGKDPVSVFSDWADDRVKAIGSEWEDDQNNLLEAKDLGIAMLEGYLAEYEGEDRFDVLATEHTLKRPIPTPEGNPSKCLMVARLDGLVRDWDTGKLFAMEHKTYKRLNESWLDLDHQMTIQVWLGQYLAKTLGIEEEVAGVLYNGLRKQKPGPRVSVPLFMRQKVYRNANQIDVALTRAYWKYRETNRDMAIFPEPNPVRCGWCDFREPCTELQMGGDYEFLLGEFFTKRER